MGDERKTRRGQRAHCPAHPILRLTPAFCSDHPMLTIAFATRSVETSEWLHARPV